MRLLYNNQNKIFYCQVFLFLFKRYKLNVFSKIYNDKDNINYNI